MYREELTVEQLPEYTLRVLTYEIGDIHKIIIHTERLGRAGYLGEMQAASGDAMTMLNLFCEQENFDIEETRQLGFTRFQERMAQLAKSSQARKTSSA
jgi:hypothetical protein